MHRCEDHCRPLVQLDPVFNSQWICPDCLYHTANQALKRVDEALEERDVARHAEQQLFDGWCAAIRNATIYIKGERLSPLGITRDHWWVNKE